MNMRIDKQPHRVASRDEWIEASRRLVAREKELTRAHDRLAEERRALPWVRIDKDYRFGTPAGEQRLIDLFGGNEQLLVYHFMLAPGDEAGCIGCSFLLDHIDGVVVHLRHHGVSVVAVSRAPLEEIERYRARMGGARLTYTTSEPALVDAIHAWFDRQVTDHGPHATTG